MFENCCDPWVIRAAFVVEKDLQGGTSSAHERMWISLGTQPPFMMIPIGVSLIRTNMLSSIQEQHTEQHNLH